MSQRTSLARAAGAVSLAVAMSRLMGVAREVVIASQFTRAVTDAFWAAFRIPNILRDLLAEGALSAAFVPVFAEVREKQGRKAAFRLASSVVNALLVATGLFALSIVFLANEYVSVVVPGFTPERLALAALLARLMAPFLVAISIAAVLMGISNVEGKFFVPSAAPALFNLGVIAGGLLLAPVFAARGWPAVTGLAIGAVAGGTAQLLVQIPGIWRMGFRHEWILDFRDPAFRKIMVRLGPALLGVAATYLSMVVDNGIASWYGEGPVSFLSYAMRLWLLPVGLFGVAISIANLAGVARDAARGDSERLKATLATSVRFTLLFSLPSATALIVLGRPIVRVVYEHGKFTSDATQATALLLACYAIGLPGYSLVKLYVPTLYALGRPWIPVGITFAVVLLKVASNLVLWRLQFGYAFLAATTALASLANAGATAWVLRRHTGPLRGQGLLATLGWAAGASALMAGAVLGIGVALESRAGGGWLDAAAVLGLQIVVGLSIVGAVVLVSGLPEAERLRAILRRASSREDPR